MLQTTREKNWPHRVSFDIVTVDGNVAYRVRERTYATLNEAVSDLRYQNFLHELDAMSERNKILCLDFDFIKDKHTLYRVENIDDTNFVVLSGCDFQLPLYDGFRNLPIDESHKQQFCLWCAENNVTPAYL